jgi:hypothetical protein
LHHRCSRPVFALCSSPPPPPPPPAPRLPPPAPKPSPSYSDTVASWFCCLHMRLCSRRL